MFVLADIEWVTDKTGKKYLVQIAASRVDENWEEKGLFSSFVNPGKRNWDWKHIAYTGTVPTDIIFAKTALQVLANFRKWLKRDDVLIWWHEESETLFDTLNKNLLKAPLWNKTISIRKYVYTFFKKKDGFSKNAYKLAESIGIDTKPELKHCSENDVRVMREMLKLKGCAQKEILLYYEDKEKYDLLKAIENLPYRYDPETNMLHSKNCTLIVEKKLGLEGRSSMRKAVKKKYIPCDCCKAEFEEEINKHKIHEEIKPSYFYTIDSKVFHKCGCGLVRNAIGLMETTDYERLVESGKKPCTLCNPCAENDEIFLPEIKIKSKKLSKTAKKSVKRHRIAISEREAKLESIRKEQQKKQVIERYKKAKEDFSNIFEKGKFSDSELHDIYVKTNPNYVFWVGQGYETFHSHGCCKLRGLRNLKGFRTYEEAVKAGYKPCKKCKPSPKQNLKYSIPVDTKIRANEKFEDIKIMCKEANYSYCKSLDYIHIKTPVGKWRMDIHSKPIKLEHMNFVSDPWCKDYHDQPRRFFSFTDAFIYIKDHDERLAWKKSEGKAFIKYCRGKKISAI